MRSIFSVFVVAFIVLGVMACAKKPSSTKGPSQPSAANANVDWKQASFKVDGMT